MKVRGGCGVKFGSKGLPEVSWLPWVIASARPDTMLG